MHSAIFVGKKSKGAQITCVPQIEAMLSLKRSVRMSMMNLMIYGQALSNAYLIANVGFDTDENELPKVSRN